MQVLMIEDNEDDYLLIRHSVARIGDVQIEWHTTVDNGLAYLDSHPVDLLLLDMSLPDGYGLEILDRVQARFHALPIIILSGDGTDELAFEAIRRGAQDYLVKGQIDRNTLGRSLRYAVERKRLQERLRESEELYRTFARNFPNGALILYDHDLRYTLIDGLGISDVGLSKADMEGKTLQEILSAEAYRRAEPRLRAVLAGETFSQEVSYPGQTLLVNYVPIRDKNGTILAGMMMTQNITERKQVEEALRTSEEQFRSAFNNAAVGMALVAPDGAWLQVNRALCGILGYSEPELLKKTFQDLTHPDDLDIDLRYVAQVLAGEIESYQMEKRYFHKQGHEVWVLLSVSLVRDRQGQPIHFISQIQDITQRKQAEAALAAERNMLRTLIDHMPDYVFVKDADGRFVVSNEAHTRASETTIEKIVGKTSLEVFPQILADQYYADDLAVIQSGQPLINAERRTPDPAGQEKWGLTTKVPLRDADGKVTGLVGITRDITERKQMEEALTARMAAEHEFQDYLKTLHEITIELTTITDLDDFYKQAVGLGLQRLGFDRLGLLLYDQEHSLALGTYGTDVQGNLVAEHDLRLDPSGLTSILTRAIQTEGRFAVDEQAELFSNLQPIGTGWNAAAVLWNGSDKLGWLATDNGVHHLPITQTQLNVLALYALTLGTLLAQKRSQIAVQESERQLRLLAQNSPDVIYILDLIEQRPTYLNRAEFLGYSQSEIESSGSILFALHPDDKERVLAHWRSQVSGGNRDTLGMIEYRLQDKFGQWQWLQSRETIFASTADAKPSQILVTLTVITERKQAEEQALELANERERVHILSDFVRDTSHDFRTPLSTINTSLYILSKTTDLERRKTSLATAEHQISRLTHLIDRLLIMARLDSETAFALQRVDLDRLVGSFCAQLTYEAKAKGVTVVSSISESGLVVQANMKELNLALAELGNNAIWYTPANGTITIRTSREGNQAVIEVSDTGIGIPAAEFSQIFQRLYRVDKARSAETGGAGLGLSIARRIIELHQGSITVESVVEQGSSFRVFLPLSE